MDLFRMKKIVDLLAVCLILIASALVSVIGQEVFYEDWDDEVEEATAAANHEESERFRKLVSISNEFDASIFEGELVHEVGGAGDGDNVRRGRRLLQQAANLLADQAALLDFKQGITMDPNGTLQGWNTSANLVHCAWIGITCSNLTGRVIGLNLTGGPGAKLGGTISRNISMLSSLMSLTVTQHLITGPIPVELGNLKNLKLLNLHNNNLTGYIPTQLASCSLLETLDLGSNNLTGSIPHELVQCSNLVEIDVSSNHLGGEIDPGFGTLPNLTMFLAMFNNLTGILPPSFGNCTQLIVLALNNNHLEGTIPSSLENCLELQGLLVGYNNITGTLPRGFSKLQKLSIVYFQNNTITGEVDFLQNCSRMWQIHGENNNLTGSLPTFFVDTCESLTHLYFQGNDLEGTISASLANCSNLVQLHLNSNPKLTGIIPPEFGRLQKLQNLVVFNTQVSGEIPAILGNCSALINLVLNNNTLTGHIPETLGNLVNLTLLILSDNKLAGPIPSSLSNCKKLQRLDFSDNNLTGGIPSSLQNCYSLQSILLNNNSLDGQFSLDMSNMSKLQGVSARTNLITGDLFASLATLNSSGNQLFSLDFSGNSLDSMIPATFDVAKLSELRVLLLRNNRLQGSVPPWLWNLPALQLLGLSNNSLTGQLRGNFSNLRGYIDTDTNGNNPLDNSSTYIQSVVITVNDKDVVYNTFLRYVISMQLSHNQLAGNIPADITKLVKMSYLDLSWNSFRGSIPENIGDVPLTSLDLSNNHLSGEIPQSLPKNARLQSLFLANNSLSGQIPSGSQLQSQNINAFRPGNEKLCGSPLQACSFSGTDRNSFNGLFAVPGFVLGFFTGFLVVAIVILLWKPVRRFVHLDQRNTATGRMVSFRISPLHEEGFR